MMPYDAMVISCQNKASLIFVRRTLNSILCNISYVPNIDPLVIPRNPTI